MRASFSLYVALAVGGFGCATVEDSPKGLDDSRASRTGGCLDIEKLSPYSWSKKVGSGTGTPLGVMIGDLALISTPQNVLLALDSVTGDQRASTSLGFPIGDLVRLGDDVLIASNEPEVAVRIARIRGRTLETIWVKKMDSRGAAHLALLDEGSALIGTSDGFLYKLDVNTGELGTRIARDSAGFKSLLYSDGQVFLATLNRLRDLNLHSLESGWDLDLIGWHALSLLRAKDTLFVAVRTKTSSARDQVWRVSVTDGKRETLFTVPENESLNSRILLQADRLFIGSTAATYCLEAATGKILWKSPLRFRSGDLSICGATVVSGWDGGVMFLDGETGTVLNRRAAVNSPIFTLLAPKSIVTVGGRGDVLGIPSE